MKIHVLSPKIYTLLLSSIFTWSGIRAQNVHVYVSPNGSSTGDGINVSAPVNLQRARAVVRAHPSQACIVYLANGSYPAFSLDATDKRTASSPAVYTSSQRYGAVFQPVNTISRSQFQPIPDSIKSRIIDATAKTKVMQIPLRTLGIVDTVEWPAFSLLANLKSPKFYKDGIPLPMSRYPAAEGTMPMKQVVNKGSGNSVPGGSFKYHDDRGKYWQKAIADGGVYLSGNWQAQFEIDVLKTKSISTIDSLITQSIGILGGLGAQPYGRLVSGQEPYYALNLVEEITAEGQYSVNFKTKMLYMWVPASGTITYGGNCKVPAISATQADNTWFMNMAVRGGSGNGIELHDCDHVLIAGTHITYCSGNGVTITDGTNCTVQSNDIDSVGAGGVIISSSNFTADQFNVKLSKHKVINNHIYSYAREAFLYSGAVNVQSAVGTYIAYNRIHDCPHVGILYGGNSNVLEYNEVFDVVKKYADMGAFYKVEMGQLWLSRGNKLNHNYVHDALPAVGFYTDNYSSGDSTNYNIVVHVQGGFFTHMGYYNNYANNIVVNTQYPVTSQVETTASSLFSTHYNSLKTIWTNSAAYRAAYPECAAMVGSATPDWAYTSKIWPSFTGCVFTANPGILSNSNIDLLFNKDGTTNATYAQTGPVFTTLNTVWQKNIRLNGQRLYPIAPFNLDSLKVLKAFGMTAGTDWHINRIGLHKDSYRTDISATRIPECDPVMTVKATSSNSFQTPGTIYLTMGIKFPNAANVITSTFWYDNGKVITGLYIQKKVVAYDSVTYIAQWTNPPAGTHSVYVTGKDGDFWSYNSNTIGFNLTAVKAAATQDSVVSGSAARQLTADSSTATASSDSAKTAVSDMLNATALSIFPNPAATQLNVGYTAAAAQANTKILVYDLLGRIVLQRTVDFQAGPNQVTLYLSNLPTGSYLLVLQAQHSAALSRRFVINH
jgi:hypothetical protein